MKRHWETKKHYWKIDIYPWWKQFRFGFWWDSDYDVCEIIISFAFWEIDIWKTKKELNK